jgi:hypothetical protein
MKTAEVLFTRLDMERIYLLGILNRESLDMNTLLNELPKSREKFELAINFIKSIPKEEVSVKCTCFNKSIKVTTSHWCPVHDKYSD